MTCVNSQVAPSIIQLIKDHPDYEINVIGCDASPAREILGRHFYEKCFSVPMGDSEHYIEAIEKITKDHDVQLIFPGSDEECITLSRHRDTFQSSECRVACSDYTVVSVANDKYRMMMTLKEKGGSTGDVYSPQTLKDIEAFALQLGYPEKEFVIKPRAGRGSRGFKIVTARYDRYKAFRNSIFDKLSLEELIQIFDDRQEEISHYLMMEIYPGDKYSADVLVTRGDIVSMVIRNNGPFPKMNPPTQNATIVFDKDVRLYAESVIKTMPFDFFAQVEIGRDDRGYLGLIEVNTRMDATLPITEGLGLNFFREMITYAMTGKMRSDIPDYNHHPKKLRFRRYWCHLFEETDSDE